MSFWERGYLATASAVLIAGVGYFIAVWQQSLALGTVAPPNWSTFGLYLIIVTIISAGSFIVFASFSAVKSGDIETVGDFDERDRLINVKSLATTSYITSTGTYLVLVWFLFHGDSSLLFHSMIGVLMISEIAMCLLHVFNYNRAY